MTISRVSTLSLGIVFAVIALGYASPAFAPPPVCPSDHPKCKDDSGEDPATTFSVEMQQGELPDEASGLVISTCAGTTEDQGQGELDVSFPDGCVTVTDVLFMSPPIGAEVTLRAFALLVRANRSDVVIFFTDGHVSGNTNTGGVYVSERLAATISRNGGPITVDVNTSGLVVEKNHQPNKGHLVGPIAIGQIVYTPD